MKLYYFFPSTRLCSSSPSHTFLALVSLSRCFFSAVCFVFFGWLCEDYSWRHGIAVFAPLSWVYVGRRAHDVTVLQSSHDQANDDDVHTRERPSERVKRWELSGKVGERLRWGREVREENCWEKSKASYILITSILRYNIDVTRTFFYRQKKKIKFSYTPREDFHVMQSMIVVIDFTDPTKPMIWRGRIR